MDVNLRPEHIERLNQLAETSGRGTDDLIAQAVHNFLEYEDWFDAKVQKGLDDIEQGRLLTTEEVQARINRILKT